MDSAKAVEMLLRKEQVSAKLAQQIEQELQQELLNQEFVLFNQEPGQVEQALAKQKLEE